MSYTIVKTNGTTLGTILDGTVNDSATSLTLVGRNYSNYGQIMTNNLVALLENFSYNIAPSNAIQGQLWWDSASIRLKVYTGTFWKNVGSCTAQSTPPNTTVAGDLWWDTTDEQLYIYNGLTPFNANGWILVGPPWKKTKGKSGALWETISDGVGDHEVVSIYHNGTRTAVISQDAAFAPSPSIVGFAVIQRGYNMTTVDTLGTIWGTANNSSYLGLQPASNYLRSDISDITYVTLTIDNNGGLIVGNTANLQITTTTGGGASFKNTKNNQDIDFYVNLGGVNTNVLNLDGATGRATEKSLTLSDTTTSTSYSTGALVVSGGAGIAGTLNVGGLANFDGVATTVTAPYLTANTMIATTEFVINNSGFVKNKIYEGATPNLATTFMEVVDTGTGYANLSIDGVGVLTASASGVNLRNGATAATQSQSHPTTYHNGYVATGDTKIATTNYVKEASKYWSGSAKWVSTDVPNPGVNDTGSQEGDFWFQLST